MPLFYILFIYFASLYLYLSSFSFSTCSGPEVLFDFSPIITFSGFFSGFETLFDYFSTSTFSDFFDFLLKCDSYCEFGWYNN